MPPKRKQFTAKDVLARLERIGTKKTVDGMARYGITTQRHVVGVPTNALLKLAKEIGTDHALALALWKTNCYEAQMLASLIDDAAQVTTAQMDAWTNTFDNWAIVDTVCFKLFDQSPHAWKKAPQYARSRKEFVKRTGVVLMACLALHDKSAADKQFKPFLPMLEKCASDDRNFVMKGVSWALRSIGPRSAALHKATIAVANRLAKSETAASKWVGKDALRALNSAKVQARLKRKLK